MKTLSVDASGTLKLLDIPEPSYNSRQALVKTVSCGICGGTDGKLIHRVFKGVPLSQYPLILGHEGVGKVVAVGSDVKNLHVGDHVLLPFVDPDPNRYPGLGSAWGAYSEYGVVHDLSAYPEGEAPECAWAQTVLPPDIDPVDGAMIITLREVFSAIGRFGITSGSSTAVFGCGPVGLTFIRLMKLMGVYPIIAFARSDDKTAEAAKAGADYVFNTRKTDPGKAIREICPQGVSFVIDAVGLTSLINDSMEYLCDNGRMCCYGIAPECTMSLDWSRAPYNWQLHFQQFPSKYEEGMATDQIIAWIRSGDLNLKDYISDYFSFDRILTAFDCLEKKMIKKKGIIVYK